MQLTVTKSLCKSRATVKRLLPLVRTHMARVDDHVPAPASQVGPQKNHAGVRDPADRAHSNLLPAPQRLSTAGDPHSPLSERIHRQCQCTCSQ